MKGHQNSSSSKTVDNGRPDYYITPTRDFTQYTRDSEEKYWSKETKFDWQQSVPGSLKEHLDNLDSEAFSKIFFMVLPMVEVAVNRKIVQVQQQHLPLDEDALKNIAECVPFDRPAIHQALLIQSPLTNLRLSVSKSEDQLEILNRSLLDLTELLRMGLFDDGTKVKQTETEDERNEQVHQVSLLTGQIEVAKTHLQQTRLQHQIEAENIRTKIRNQLNSIEFQVLLDLEETRELLKRTLKSGTLPLDSEELIRLKDLILKRQLRGLKDIANHALVVEQSAIAPLSTGIIHYKRYREIQEAMTTFINDEAKHSATFRRFLVEKLEAREFISAKLIKGANRYMWLARFLPATGMFLAVLVEAIGAAYLEFFGKEKYMPDRLFCSISKTISDQDETRHMDLCVAIYNELFWRGTQWEKLRNKVALKVLLRSIYGDKTEDHHLIQAFRAFGVESQTLYRHITNRLSQQLARISVFVEPEKLMEIIGIDRK